MEFKLRKNPKGSITITDNETFSNGFMSADGKGIDFIEFMDKLPYESVIIVKRVKG